MAEKMIFLSDGVVSYDEKIIAYTFVPGFSPTQRKKNVANLESAIAKEYPGKKVLEISTKSDNELGRKLSAFNLKLDGHFIESIFQSSKVFSDGKQYEFLIEKKPLEAKRFIKNLPSKEIVGFRYEGIDYPTEPKSLFYDFIYIKALKENSDVAEQLKDFDIFTDIEFNHKKSINCQARACAIYSYLLKTDKVVEYTKDVESFQTLYEGVHSDTISLF